MRAQAHHATATAYTLELLMQGDTFFGAFDFEAAPDPTHGYIDYVNQSECERAGIINVTAKQVRMAVDNRKVQQEPRKSVRLASKVPARLQRKAATRSHAPTDTWRGRGRAGVELAGGQLGGAVRACASLRSSVRPNPHPFPAPHLSPLLCPPAERAPAVRRLQK